DDARKIDKSINLNDVKQFFNENVEKKTNLKGYNSFIAPHPYYEYQMDLFFIPNDEFLENQNFRVGMLMIDVFTKYMWVVPLKSKSEGDIASGLIECMHKMGKKPKILFTDDETALSSDSIQKYLKEQGIKHLITRTSAWFAERGIKTIKSMLYKRVESSKKKNIQWNDLIFEILLTYNNKLKNTTTKLTPSDARKPEHEFDVRINLLLNKKHTRLYPELNTNDKVKIYRKKRTGEKERTSKWSDNSYEIEKVGKSLGQTYYKLKGVDRQYLRHELFKV
ncbi:MAG TPA: transposase family protein, partial [Allocoleopsis sp.]